MKKKLIIISIITIALLVVVAVVAITLFRDYEGYDGRIAADTHSKILIERDAQGVPLIRVKEIRDAYFAIGYLHAQDRLAQIEYFRAIARGRLSEIIGSRGVMLDRLARTIGFVRRADEIMRKLKGPHQEYLDSYVKGINSYKNRYMEKLFKVVDIPEGEWHVVDVLSTLLLFEWADSYLNNHELFFSIVDSLNRDSLKDIIPEKLRYSYAKEERDNVLILKEIKRMLEDFVGSYVDGFAVFVSGENTESGKSLVCYNLDSSVSMFPKWYPLSIVTDGMRINGLTISGLPFIFIGNNDHISFSGFNLNVDTQDFFRETVRVDDQMQYLYRGVWEDFDSINEIIRVGRGDGRKNLIALSIRDTERGPVISDIFRDTHKTDVITIKSILPDESYISLLFEIPLSDSIGKAMNLAVNVYSLPKIYLFGSADRAVQAYSGRLPVRNVRERIIWDSSYSHWSGLLDLSYFRRMVTYKNAIIGSSMYENEPDAVKRYAVFNDLNRYYRLKELIEKGHSIKRNFLEKMLFDSHSVIAERFVPLFLAILKKNPITSARLSRIYFHQWDLKMKRDSVPASIFQTILVKMISEAVSDELKGKGDIMEGYYLLLDNFYSMISDDRSPLFDDMGTDGIIENRDMIFDRAFLRAMRFLNKAKGPIMASWKWGAIHRGRYHMPIKDDSLIVKLLSELKDSELKGGNSTIYRCSISAEDSFGPGTATSLSGIVDKGDMYLSTSFGISLNPYSEYFNMFSEGEEFNTFLQSEGNHQLTLIPVK
jgi:penicillin amidase